MEAHDGLADAMLKQASAWLILPTPSGLEEEEEGVRGGGAGVLACVV